MRDFERYQAVFITARLTFRQNLGSSRAHAVKVAADFFEGTERQIGNSCRQKQREQNCGGGEQHGMLKSRSELIFQEDRRNAYADGAERRPIQL